MIYIQTKNINVLMFWIHVATVHTHLSLSIYYNAKLIFQTEQLSRLHLSNVRTFCFGCGLKIMFCNNFLCLILGKNYNFNAFLLFCLSMRRIRRYEESSRSKQIMQWNFSENSTCQANIISEMWVRETKWKL